MPMGVSRTGRLDLNCKDWLTWSLLDLVLNKNVKFVTRVGWIERKGLSVQNKSSRNQNTKASDGLLYAEETASIWKLLEHNVRSRVWQEMRLERSQMFSCYSKEPEPLKEILTHNMAAVIPRGLTGGFLCPRKMVWSISLRTQGVQVSLI